MPAANYDFECEQGATFKEVIKYEDVDGAAINLVGSTVRMDVRYGRNKTSDLLVSMTTDNGKANLLNAEHGQIQLLISATETASFQQGKYYYDIEVQNSATPPVVDRLLEGAFTVDAEVTG